MSSTRQLCAAIASLAIAHSIGIQAHASDSDDIAAALAQTRIQLEALQAQVAELEAKLASQTPTVSGQLEDRVEELEVIASEVDESIGSRALVNVFDGNTLDIGGFFDTAATIAIGEASTEASFNRQVFELLVKAELGRSWELFVAQAFVRNAPLSYADPVTRTTPLFADNNSPVATDTVIAWGQYHHSDVLNVQFGRFITPHGIVNIEHFPASLLDTEQPQFLRPFPGQTLFANFTNGVNIHGARFFGDNALSYAAYAGVWAGNSSKISYGGRLAYAFTDQGLTIGVNAMSGDRSSATPNDRFHGLGIDVLYNKGPVLWKSEIFATSEGVGGDKFAFYSQPALRLTDQWTILYRYDYLDNGSLGGQTIEHVGGIVFDPVANVRLRALYRNSHRRADFPISASTTNIIQFATTLNF